METTLDGGARRGIQNVGKFFHKKLCDFFASGASIDGEEVNASSCLGWWWLHVSGAATFSGESVYHEDDASRGFVGFARRDHAAAAAFVLFWIRFESSSVRTS